MQVHVNMEESSRSWQMNLQCCTRLEYIDATGIAWHRRTGWPQGRRSSDPAWTATTS